MRQFEHVVAHELPVVYDDFELSREARAAVEDYVTDVQNWMSGILNWHRRADRYKEAWLSRRAHGFLPDRPPAPALPVG
jgi:germacradienol/geosmin synthase